MYWDIMTPYYDYVVGNNHMNMFKRGRIFSAKSIFLFIELKSFVELPTLWVHFKRLYGSIKLKNVTNQ